MDIAQVAYNKAQYNVTEYKEQDRVSEDEATATMTDCTAEVRAVAISFSSFDDKHNYNGKVLLKYSIGLVMFFFNHQQSFKEVKMHGLTASMLKLTLITSLQRKFMCGQELEVASALTSVMLQYRMKIY